MKAQIELQMPGRGNIILDEICCCFHSFLHSVSMPMGLQRARRCAPMDHIHLVSVVVLLWPLPIGEEKEFLKPLVGLGKLVL